MAIPAKGRQKQPGLDRAAWVAVAMVELAHGGIDAVRVEILARKLGVTKGSFYWHFKDRADLHDAMLEHWRQTLSVEVIHRLGAIEDPMQRYTSMMRLAIENGLEFLDMRAGTQLESAVRLWARRDPKTRAALAEANELRLNFIIDVLLAAGAPVATARARAILIFSCISLGSELLDSATLKQCQDLLLGLSE